MPEHIIKKGAEVVGATPPPGELEQARNLLREYGQPLLLGLGLAAAVLLGFAAYRGYRHNSALKASQLLARAGSMEQLQQVVSQYPSTPSAPLALLTMAARQFEGGQYELAQYTYSQFEQKYPKHPMRPAAELNRAQCIEAMGDLDRALAAFADFAAANPEHYLAAPAQLSRARVLTQMRKLDEARAAYEDFLVRHPDSGWAALAENSLEYVRRLLRGGAPGAVEPAPLSMPFALEPAPEIPAAGEEPPVTNPEPGTP